MAPGSRNARQEGLRAMNNAQKSFSESGGSPPRRVTLTRIDLVPGCTAGAGAGRDADGNEVTFAADWRPCLTIWLVHQRCGSAAVVAPQMMYPVAIVDHPVVDGREAVTFFKRIEECVAARTHM